MKHETWKPETPKNPKTENWKLKTEPEAELN